jgi:hypothetical protein
VIENVDMKKFKNECPNYFFQTIIQLTRQEIHEWSLHAGTDATGLARVQNRTKGGTEMDISLVRGRHDFRLGCLLLDNARRDKPLKRHPILGAEERSS